MDKKEFCYKLSHMDGKERDHFMAVLAERIRVQKRAAAMKDAERNIRPLPDIKNSVLRLIMKSASDSILDKQGNRHSTSFLHTTGGPEKQYGGWFQGADPMYVKMPDKQFFDEYSRNRAKRIYQSNRPEERSWGTYFGGKFGGDNLHEADERRYSDLLNVVHYGDYDTANRLHDPRYLPDSRARMLDRFSQPRPNTNREWWSGKHNSNGGNGWRDFSKTFDRTSGLTAEDGEYQGGFGMLQQGLSNTTQGLADATAGEIGTVGLLSKLVGVGATGLGAGLSYIDREGRISSTLRDFGTMSDSAGSGLFNAGEKVKTFGDKSRTFVWAKTPNDYHNDGSRSWDNNEWTGGVDPDARWTTNVGASSLGVVAAPLILKHLPLRRQGAASVEASASGLGQSTTVRSKENSKIGARISASTSGLGNVSGKMLTNATKSQVNTQGQQHNDLLSEWRKWLDSRAYKSPR